MTLRLARPFLAAALAAACLAALPAGDKADHARRVELFTVDGCSLACAFCCESTRIAQKRLLPTATVQARLREAARGTENVVPFILDCARSYCTLYEIRAALEDVFGAYREPVFF